MYIEDILTTEQATLGAAMLTEEAADKVASLLSEASFTQEAHKVIFAAVAKLRRDKMPVDPVTLVDALGDRLADIGGLGYLSKLSMDTPTDANLDYYITAVRENHQKRTFTEGLQKALSTMREGGDYILAAQRTIAETAKISTEAQKPSAQQWTDAVLSIGKQEAGIRTGYRVLDAMTGGLKAGHVTIVAGRPGMGKTSFALGLAVNAALQGKVVAVFSLEMPLLDILTRACYFSARVNEQQVLRDTYGNGSGAAVLAMAEAAERNSKANLYVYDNVRTLAGIREKLWSIKRKHGRLDLVVIDYIGLIRPEGGRRNGTREQEIAEISREIKLTAVDFDCSVLLLSQLNRALEGRTDPTPKLSDLRESGSIEQDADECLFLFRPSVYDSTADEKAASLIVAKNRYGRTGEIDLCWFGDQYRYADPTAQPTQTELADAIPCPFEG